MDLNFYFNIYIKQAFAISFVLSFFLIWFGTKAFKLKEVVREELGHKKKQNGIGTSSGLVFGFLFLSIINLFSGNYFLSICIFLFLFIIGFIGKRVFSKIGFSILFISIISIYFLNYSLLKSPFRHESTLITSSLFLILILGFFDDMSKLNYGKGLKEKILFLFQSLIALIPTIYNISKKKSYIQLLTYKFELGYFYIPFGVLVFNSCVNSANLTDGLNGGLGFSSIVIFLFFIVHSLKIFFTNSSFLIPIYNHNYILFSVVIIGCLIPFLFFNMINKTMMGNIGSMFIGALIANMAMMMKSELLLPLNCIVLVIETTSVIIQQTFYKKFKKRLFLFTPIHHHFELLGWSNKKIVSLMTFVSIIGCSIAIIFI
ncbi:MAG: hypothetical protein ACK5XN_12415 [Bacteroidota bacterium]